MDPWIDEILDSAPAMMITGARASGKTTTALRHAASVVRLDNEREAGPFRADPDAALRERPEPVLLDEWQACPEVLGAVKRAVDTERRAGRFILTSAPRSPTPTRLCGREPAGSSGSPCTRSRCANRSRDPAIRS